MRSEVSVERPGIIYLAVNRVNGKPYVGQTKVPFKARICNHISCAAMDRDQTPFHRALRKYGSEAFDYAVLETVPPETLNEREAHWILQIGSKTPFGYNRTHGGQGAPGVEYSEEHRNKIRVSKLGDRNPMRNPATARKHGDAIKGANHVFFGRTGALHPTFGKTHTLSEETKAKQRLYANRPEVVAARRARMLSRQAEMNSEEIKAKRSAGLKRHWNTPEGRAQKSEMIRKTWLDPARREKSITSLKSSWQRRKSEGTMPPHPMLGVVVSEETKRMISDSVRATLSSPEVRAKMRKPRSAAGCFNISLAKKGKPWTQAQRDARAAYTDRKGNQ